MLKIVVGLRIYLFIVYSLFQYVPYMLEGTHIFKVNLFLKYTYFKAGYMQLYVGNISIYVFMLRIEYTYLYVYMYLYMCRC